MSSSSLPYQIESARFGMPEAREALGDYETPHGLSTSPGHRGLAHIAEGASVGCPAVVAERQSPPLLPHPPMAHDQFGVGIRRLWTPLLAWWCQHFVTISAWPPDVREYIIRSALGMVGDGRGLGPEDQLKLAKMEMFAMSRDDLTPELKLMLLRDGDERWARVPHEKCARCGLQVPTHQATSVGGEFYHDRCAPWQDASGRS